MIHLIENLPGNVVGLKAEGKVTREDYELRIMPQIRAREREFDKIRLIYVLGGDFMGYTAPWYSIAHVEDPTVGVAGRISCYLRWDDKIYLDASGVLMTNEGAAEEEMDEDL